MNLAALVFGALVMGGPGPVPYWELPPLPARTLSAVRPAAVTTATTSAMLVPWTPCRFKESRRQQIQGLREILYHLNRRGELSRAAAHRDRSTGPP